MGLFGKLFEKKECAICGGEIGLLGNRKLEDGNLCKDCAKLISPFMTDRRQSTGSLHVGQFLVLQGCHGSLLQSGGGDGRRKFHWCHPVEHGCRICDRLAAFLVYGNALCLYLHGSGSENGGRQGWQNVISFHRFAILKVILSDFTT